MYCVIVHTFTCPSRNRRLSESCHTEQSSDRPRRRLYAGGRHTYNVSPGLPAQCYRVTQSYCVPVRWLMGHKGWLFWPTHLPKYDIMICFIFIKNNKKTDQSRTHKSPACPHFYLCFNIYVIQQLVLGRGWGIPPLFSSAVPPGSGAFQMPIRPSSSAASAASASTLRGGRANLRNASVTFSLFLHEASLGWH